MKTSTKDGVVKFELLKPERKRLVAAVTELAGMTEYTRLKDKAEAAIEAIRDVFQEFEPESGE
jgi:hypothetical protein